MNNSGIVRNRAKIEGAITNAILFSEIIEEFGSFTAYIWKFVKGSTMQPRRKSIVDLPCQIPESQALSKDMKDRGFKFVGPTVMYSHMQATGLVNDHTVDCFRCKQLT
jgi:DNA-3-methyladenine glycosylase I